MQLLELARIIQADRERTIQARLAMTARMSSGRRHPAGPEHGLPEADAPVSVGRIRTRPAVG